MHPFIPCPKYLPISSLGLAVLVQTVLVAYVLRYTDDDHSRIDKHIQCARGVGGPLMYTHFITVIIYYINKMQYIISVVVACQVQLIRLLDGELIRALSSTVIIPIARLPSYMVQSFSGSSSVLLHLVSTTPPPLEGGQATAGLGGGVCGQLVVPSLS